MKKVTRRTWIGLAVTACGGIVLCKYTSGCATFTKVGSTPAIPAGAYNVDKKSLSILLDKTPELSTVGGSVKIIDARLPMPLIVARTGETTFAVVSLFCPHRNVEIEYRHQEKHFRCASLGHSQFALDGKVLKSMTTKESISHYNAALDPSDKNNLIIML
jgi:hypothetical protein